MRLALNDLFIQLRGWLNSSPVDVHYPLQQYRGWFFFLFLICAALLRFLQGQFMAPMHVNGLSIYFFDAVQWNRFIAILREAKLLGAFKDFVIVDFFFIVSYVCVLWSLLHNFTVRKWQVLFGGFAIVLICADIIEDIHYCALQNASGASQIKFMAACGILIMLASNWIGRSLDKLGDVIRTLWYCRLSVVGVLLILLFVQVPQGRELIVYMLESDLDLLYLFGFSIAVFMTGICLYYLPRYLFPENPRDGVYHFGLIHCYDRWLEHIKSPANASATDVARGLHVEEDEKEAVAFESRKIQMQAQDAFHIPLVTKRMDSSKGLSFTDPEVEERKSPPNYKVQIPLVLTSLFYFVIITRLVQLSSKLNNSPGSSDWTEILSLAVRMTMVIFVALLIAYPTMRHAVRDVAKKVLRGKWIGWVLLVLLLLGGMMLYCGTQVQRGVNATSIYALVILSLIQLLCIYVVAQKGNQGGLLNKKWRQFYHQCILFLLYGSMLFYLVYLFFLTKYISLGIITLLFVLLFYYGLQLILTYKGKVASNRSYYLTVVFLFFVMAMVVSGNIDNNHLDVVTVPGRVEGKSLSEFTREFKALHADADSTKPVPVYFIAANGGGTMQAYWTASVLAHLRDSTDRQIDNHIFAMSGASGGAVGLGVSLMLWDCQKDSLRLYVDSIYKRDYLSGALGLMLGSDLWISVLPIDMSCKINRNKWLRERYSLALKDYFRTDTSDWDRPFRSLWDHPGWRPLYFANTTRVEDGQRAYASPFSAVAMKTSGVSILDSLNRRNETLNFGEAVMLTNRFPYINTSGKIDGLGHFVDGGYHDNSGIETLLELYYAVKHELFDGTNFYPHFIHIDFGTGAWKHYDEWEEKRSKAADGLIADNLGELSVPLVTAIGSILGAPVYDRVDRVSFFEIDSVSRVYLPGAEIFSDKDSFVNEKIRDSFEDIHVRLVETPLGRTISRNQRDFVRQILRTPTLQPVPELDAIIRETMR